MRLETFSKNICNTQNAFHENLIYLQKSEILKNVKFEKQKHNLQIIIHSSRIQITLTIKKQFTQGSKKK